MADPQKFSTFVEELSRAHRDLAPAIRFHIRIEAVETGQTPPVVHLVVTAEDGATGEPQAWNQWRLSPDEERYLPQDFGLECADHVSFPRAF